MTPSVSPQNALIDRVIFAATVFHAVALILISDGPVCGLHRARVSLHIAAQCRTPNLSASRPFAAATRECCYECGIALIADGHPHPVHAQRWNGHHLSLQRRRYSRSYRLE